MHWTEHRNLALELNSCADVDRFWWWQTMIWCTSVFRGKRSHHTACYVSPCSKLTLLLCWLAAPQSWAGEAQTRRNFGPNRVQLRDWRKPTDAIVFFPLWHSWAMLLSDGWTSWTCTAWLDADCDIFGSFQQSPFQVANCTRTRRNQRNVAGMDIAEAWHSVLNTKHLSRHRWTCY